jgi:hypothetical protein
MLVQTRPWDSTLRFYSDLEATNELFRSMRRLVEHVASQPYAPLLFSTTSMHALLVAQHAQIELGHDVLKVERDPYGKGVRFTFQEQPFVEPAKWECSEDEVVGTFEGFLRKVKWVDTGRT